MGFSVGTGVVAQVWRPDQLYHAFPCILIFRRIAGVEAKLTLAEENGTAGPEYSQKGRTKS
jgi:hypothetical protein